MNTEKSPNALGVFASLALAGAIFYHAIQPCQKCAPERPSQTQSQTTNCLNPYTPSTQEEANRNLEAYGSRPGIEYNEDQTDAQEKRIIKRGAQALDVALSPTYNMVLLLEDL